MKNKFLLNNKDLDFAADIKVAMLSNSPRFIWLTPYLILALVISVSVWAYFSEIETTTKASGTVLPSSKLQVIQNLEGGIVDSIYVREGQTVRANQSLVQLKKTQTDANYKKELAQYYFLEAEIQRLQAEATGEKHIKFEKKIIKNFPNAAKNERRLFRSRTHDLHQQLKSLHRSDRLLKKEFTIIQPLVARGVVAKIEKIRLQRAMNDSGAKIEDLVNRFRSESHAQLNKARVKQSVLTVALTATKDRMLRTTLTSPVSGIVHKVYVSTVGQVVKPGEKIIDVVPQDRNLTISVRIKPNDIGFIHIGQSASIQVSAYDPTIYGSLNAKVVNISPDTIAAERDERYFEVKLKTEHNYLGTDARKLLIIPGMTVGANIITGKKSILNYLLKPLLKAKQNVFSES